MPPGTAQHERAINLGGDNGTRWGLGCKCAPGIGNGAARGRSNNHDLIPKFGENQCTATRVGGYPSDGHPDRIRNRSIISPAHGFPDLHAGPVICVSSGRVLVHWIERTIQTIPAWGAAVRWRYRRLYHSLLSWTGACMRLTAVAVRGMRGSAPWHTGSDAHYHTMLLIEPLPQVSGRKCGRVDGRKPRTGMRPSMGGMSGVLAQCQVPAGPKERSKRSSRAARPFSERFRVPVPQNVFSAMTGTSSTHCLSFQANQRLCSWS